MEKLLVQATGFCWLLLLALGLCLQHAVCGQANLHTAWFNMKGASGNVRFLQDQPEGATDQITIMVNLTNLKPGTYSWAIHENPMKYEQRSVCNDAVIGGVYAHGGNLTDSHNRTTVPLNGDWNGDYSNDVISLTGPQSITGRTLVLTEEGSQTKYCAQIANSREMITAVARFDRPFAGTVTFRQERGDPEAVTSVLVDLYDVIDPMVPVAYTWQIGRNRRYSHDVDLESRCGETSYQVFNPTGLDALNCLTADPRGCPIGHLSGKFGDVIVQPIPSARTLYFIDTNLPLDGENSVLGTSLVFREATGNMLACSPILELKPKTVEAMVSMDNVKGTVRFSQDSSFDVTKIDVRFENLRGLAGGYHIHLLPPPPRTYVSDQPASSDNVGGHFNPHGITSSPPPSTGTHDQYEMGDLSGKFGLLTGLNNLNATYYDWNLSLFGRNSIIGRSLVIHKAQGDRWVCAVIGYPTKNKIVKAVFKTPTVGQIIMTQDPEDPNADTSVFIEMAYSDGSSMTTGHNWHVHTTAVANDYMSTDGSRCSSCAGHFNPFAVDLGATYDQCSPEYPQRCELGDLSGKLGPLKVSSKPDMGSGKLFLTDTHLPLSGIHSVVGRSFVIHAAEGGSPRISCADLLEIPPTESSTDVWSEGPVSGGIVFKQETIFGPVELQVNLTGLNNLAGGWHVHSLPIKSMDRNPCSALSVRGHHNPFGVPGSVPSGTMDMYEMGDLSGKFGSFEGLSSSLRKLYQDNNLALVGPRSIIGRSVVLHKSSDGSRWVCASLHRKLHEGDFVVRAMATVTTKDFSGHVRLSQTRFRTGAVGDTTVDINLLFNTTQGDIFNWTMSSNNQRGDSCTSSASVFNPYQVAIDGDYIDQCDMKTQLRCAVGDLTGKHGGLSDARAVYTDTNLPLSGQVSVLGLPLHITSTTTEQQACGVLEPDDGTGRLEHLLFPSWISFDSYKFRQVIASSLESAETWQVVSTQEPEPDSRTGCQNSTFYFIGPNLDEMDREFKQKVAEDGLGEYSPTSICRDDRNNDNSNADGGSTPNSGSNPGLGTGEETIDDRGGTADARPSILITFTMLCAVFTTLVDG